MLKSTNQTTKPGNKFYHRLESGKAYLQKHPSSLARLVEIFVGIGGNVFKMLSLLCGDISKMWRKLR